MKTFLLGFLVVALTMAASSDSDKNDGREKETDKSQLDMLQDQIKRLQDQVNDQQHKSDEQQHKSDEQQQQQWLQTKEQKLKNEELQLQLHEQKEENKKQQEENKKQQQEIKELQQQQHKNDKVQRSRRFAFDNETVEHLKELIRDEINPLIADLSLCEVGTHHTEFSDSVEEETKTISFGRNFTRTPKVAASIIEIFRHGARKEFYGGMRVEVKSPTTTKFDLHIRGYNEAILGANWIACA